MSKPHYFYDQVAVGKERFVYYCADCNCVVEVRRTFGHAGPLSGRCKSCGQPLEGRVECKLATVPEEWSDVSVNPARLAQTEPFFRQASSIPHFSLGFSKLDSLVRPLSEGRLVVLSGGPSSAVAELAAFRAQLPVEIGGLDSTVIFIDGGNRSDPYLFSSFAKQSGLKPAVAMRRVASCRTFTPYQFAALVSEHLARAVDDYGTRLVIISDALGTFNEPELDEREARRVLCAVEEGITKIKRRALVIVALASPSRYDDIITAWSDATVRFSPDGGNIKAELIKHRNRVPGITASFKLGQLLRAARTEALR